MKGKLFVKLFALVIVFSFLIHGVAAVGNTAELRDYRLPSERERPSYGSPKVSSDNEFRAKVKPLSGKQRKKLKENFTQKCSRATQEEEKIYYQNLIRILDEYGTN